MKRILFGLFVLLLSGCTMPTSTVISGSMAAPNFGIIADRDLKVVAFNPGSPAQESGMQLGDVLLDIRPTEQTAEQVEDIAREPVSFKDRSAVRAMIRETYIIDEEASLAQLNTMLTPSADGSVSASFPPVYENKTWPFLVRVQRGGEIVELEFSAAYLVPPKENPVDFPADSINF